jgi:hypothetical protein
MSEIRRKHPDASYCIASGAIWERNYKDFDLEANYREVRDFEPDIIVTAITVNIPRDQFEIHAFKEAMTIVWKITQGYSRLYFISIFSFPAIKTPQPSPPRISICDVFLICVLTRTLFLCIIILL